MLRVSLFSLFFLLYFSLFPKSKDTLVIDKKSTISLGIKLSSLVHNFSSEESKKSYSIFGKYYLGDKNVIRGFLEIQTNNYNRFYSDSSTASSGDKALIERDTSNSQINFTLGIGVERHFSGTKRLDPYVASDLTFKRVGFNSYKRETIEKEDVGNTKIVYTRDSDGGFEINLSLITGANYFITKQIALGVELGLLLKYENIGGDVVETTLKTEVNGNITSDLVNKIEQNSGFNVINIPSIDIRLLYFFN